jgi:hypothetical protein
MTAMIDRVAGLCGFSIAVLNLDTTTSEPTIGPTG